MDLKQLYDIRADLQKEYDALTDTRHNPTMGDHVSGGKSSRSVVESAADRREKIAKRIIGLENSIDEERAAILQKLTMIESPSVRVVVFLREYKCLTWQQIGIILQEDQSAPRVRYRRWLLNHERTKKE